MNGRISDLAKQMFSDEQTISHILKNMANSSPVIGSKISLDNEKYLLTDGKKHANKFSHEQIFQKTAENILSNLI